MFRVILINLAAIMAIFTATEAGLYHLANRTHPTSNEYVDWLGSYMYWRSARMIQSNSPMTAGAMIRTFSTR